MISLYKKSLSCNTSTDTDKELTSTRDTEGELIPSKIHPLPMLDTVDSRLRLNKALTVFRARSLCRQEIRYDAVGSYELILLRFVELVARRIIDPMVSFACLLLIIHHFELLLCIAGRICIEFKDIGCLPVSDI